MIISRVSSISGFILFLLSIPLEWLPYAHPITSAKWALIGVIFLATGSVIYMLERINKKLGKLLKQNKNEGDTISDSFDL